MSYEASEARQISAILHQNERVLEIGSGIGLISTLAARSPLVRKVIAYEANPILCKFQREVHLLNNVKVDVRNRVLLVDPNGKTIDFYVRKDFWASSLDSSQPYEFVKKTRVEDFQRVLDIEDPTLLVVDIEGGELDLFNGVNFNNIRRVLIEFHQNTIGRFGMKKIFDLFSAAGFHYDQWHSTGSVVVFSHVERVNAPIE